MSQTEPLLVDAQGAAPGTVPVGLGASASGAAPAAPTLVQLRVRTEFSFGETFAPIGRLVERLKALGVSAAGIVDAGTWGHVQWEEACRAAGIVPLFGAQLAVTPDLEGEDRPAMWFLALSSAGLSELYRFTSLANRQAVRGVARLTYEQVRGMSDQLAKFAGAVLDGELLRDIGAFIDIDPGSPIANRQKMKIAKTYLLRVVAVSDNVFAYPEDRQTFEMIGRTGKPSPQHLLSRQEMSAVIPEFNIGQLAAAAEIADIAKNVKLPKAPLIKVDGHLERLCHEGISKRFPQGWPDKEVYEARLARELMLIREKDFESYFLMVADMVRYAKSQMLVGPSRGSAAGSLVCYLTGITEVDPIPSNLIFERFIDVTRKDLPDIDLDFVDTKRHLIIEYLRAKYGERNVAQIGTITTYQPKSALIAVAKRLNIPPWETTAVKDALFERSSGDSRANFALLDTLEQTEPGRELLEKFPAMRLAANIEAHAQHTGIHAAGILVCNQPIETFCSVTADGIAQLDKKDAEKLNLLKIDALGLRTLGVLEDAGVPIDWYGMKFDDPAVYAVINDKRYAGIFQFEGPALQSISGQMTVATLDDLSDVTALARPGPMASGGATRYLLRRAGKEQFRVPHPKLLPYVEDTYGVVIFQETVLSICRELGDMSWEDVTLLRKAMSKSFGKEYFDQFRNKFVAGAADHDIPKAAANEIWEMVDSMGSWAFNKCLAGDTALWLASKGGNQPERITIGDLWETYHGPSASPWCRQRARRDVIAQMWCWEGGSKYRIANVKRVIANGPKPCWRYTFDDGSIVECTPEHKFVVDGKWQRAGKALIGSDWLAGELAPQPRIVRGNAAKGKCWRFGRDGSRNGKANPGYENGRTLARSDFIVRHSGDPCEDCGCDGGDRMEAHHNDFDEGRQRPKDLNWLCVGCHKKRHYAEGRRKRGEKGLLGYTKMLVASEPIGNRETFDLEMVEEPRNFVLKNGLVTHNSHSYSYAIVSYWTAYLKAKHPLEFAAATLRNSKNENSDIALLRELHKEGVPYVAFDPELSEANWAVKNGTLYGGFTGLKGIGDSKAAEYIKEREANGKLGAKSLEKLAACEQQYADLFPTESRFGKYYTDPEACNLRPGTKVIRIAEITGEGERCYIGRLRGKDLRDYNEAIRVKRRNGKKYQGQTLFLDLDIEDDTGKILTRIDRFDFEKIGRPIWDNAVLDSWWIVRGERRLWGKPDGGFKMIYVSKIQPLEVPR